MKYRVTDVMGARPVIAGTRRKAGEEISLTKAEAEFEVLRGTVEPVTGEASKTAEPQTATEPTTKRKSN